MEVMMMGIFGKRDRNKSMDVEKLLLRKEELDIAKDRVKTGDVEVGKEIVEEQKSVDVPISHEEVVIERRAVDNVPSDAPIHEERNIHIPVSRENVEVGKHTVVSGEVAVNKREIENTKHVDETVKHEEVRINKDGDPDIINRRD
jgi:uncharacterized protein (TIGR02271 family)